MAIPHQTCPCGSGLRPASCCSVTSAAFNRPEARTYPDAGIRRLLDAWEAGDRATAARLSREILDIAPAQQHALAVLARICKAEDRRDAAESLLRRLARVNPGDLYSLLDLAMLLIDKGDYLGADDYARHCVRLAPDDPNCHRLMGRLLTAMFRQAHAEHHHRRALELVGDDDPELLAILAWNLLNQGYFDEAKALYDRALARSPDDVPILRGAATCEEALRQPDAADRLLERAKQLAPGDPTIRVQHSIAVGRRGKTAQALALLDRDGAGRTITDLGADEWMQKGRMLDRLGQFEAAFAAFDQGRKAEARVFGTRYDAEGAAQDAAQAKSVFKADRLRHFPKATTRTDVAQPVFILGFPRSGTSLVEQILTAHPDVSAGDELLVVTDLTRRLSALLRSPLSYPQALIDLNLAEQRRGLDRLRDFYLDCIADLDVVDPGTTRFTDRMPLNEMHLGLISLIFPAAPLIHVVRHPLDSVLSMFSNRMDHGYHCGVSLEAASRHYVLVMDLVDHYQAEMALNYAQIRYEDIVTNRESETRRLLDLAGVAFDQRCLDFHAHGRYARTSSFGQIPQPIYEQSLYRFRHYRQHLRTIEPILRPLIDRLGYPGIDDV